MYQHFKRLGKDSLIYAGGIVASRMISILLVLLYTRVFAPADYGILDVITVLAIILADMGNLGFTTVLSMLYFKKGNEEEKQKIVTTNFLFSTLSTLTLCAIAFVASDRIAFFVFKHTAYTPYLRISIISIFFSSMITFGSNLFRLQFRPFLYLLFTLGHALVGALASFYLVFVLRMGLWGVFYGTLGSVVPFALLGIWWNRSSFRQYFSWKLAKEMLAIGLPLAPIGLAIWIVDYSNRYFLLHYRTIAEIGLYSLGYKFAAPVLLFTSAFRLANAPFQFSIADHRDSKVMYAKLATYYVFFAMIAVVGISLFAKEAVQLLIPRSYIQGYIIIAPLALGYVIYGLYQIIGIGLILAKKTHLITAAIVLGSCLSIILNFLLIPLWGIVGAAFASLISYVGTIALIYRWSQKYYHIPFEEKKNGVAFLVALLLGVGVRFVPFSSLFLALVLKIILWIVFIGLLYRMLEDRERKKLAVLVKEIYRKFFPWGAIYSPATSHTVVHNRQAICLLVLNDFTHDTRVLRHATALREAGYEVFVLALHETGLPKREEVGGVHVIRIGLTSRRIFENTHIRLFRYAEFFIRCLLEMRVIQPIACHCNDLNTLPIGYAAKKFFGALCVYDSHELQSQKAGIEDDPLWVRKGSRWLERALIRRCDATITVGDKIADFLAAQDGIKRPVVVRNIAEPPASFSPDEKNGHFGFSERHRVVLYQGGIQVLRGLENLIGAMEFLDQNVILMLIGDGPLRADLERNVKKSHLNGRIYFYGWVPPEKLLALTAQADVGIMPSLNAGLSYYYTLPNKFFEYITAGIPVATSNFPEMSSMIGNYAIGETFNPSDSRDMARAIASVFQSPEHYLALKENVRKARMELTWENEKQKLVDLYRFLIDYAG